MGALLFKLGIVPDLIISSSAKRTRQTAKRIAREVGYETDNIKWAEKLYHCTPSIFEEVIYEVSEDVKTVFIVAHNPGITDFVNEQDPAFFIENMPTCGIAGIEFEADNWINYAIEKRKVFLFEYPGKHDDAQ